RRRRSGLPPAAAGPRPGPGSGVAGRSRRSSMTRIGEGPAVCSPDLMSTPDPPEHPLLGGAEDRLDAPAGPTLTPLGDGPGRDPDEPDAPVAAPPGAEGAESGESEANTGTAT